MRALYLITCPVVAVSHADRHFAQCANSSIMWFGCCIALSVFSGPKRSRAISIIVDIVENCRRLAKLESGTYEQQDDTVNLHDLASSCMAMHRREREAGLQLDLQCPADLTIISDRQLWQHALMNLVGNAVSFTTQERRAISGSPCVTVEIGLVQDDRIRVHVRDNGPGKASSDQDFIFGLDIQRGFHSQGLGSGLGLHLSLQIIRMLRGNFELVSPLHDGRGTSFSFTVPCTLTRQAPVHSRSCHSHRLAGTGKARVVPLKPMCDVRAGSYSSSDDMTQSNSDASGSDGAATIPAELRVLLVEDDDLNVLVMQTCLQEGMKGEFGAAVHVTRAPTAEAALELIDDVCAFDLIVVDQHMEPAGGVMKGSQLVQTLSARPCTDGARRPIFCIASGNADGPADVAMFHKVGANIIWPKPYPAKERMASDIAQALFARC